MKKKLTYYDFLISKVSGLEDTPLQDLIADVILDESFPRDVSSCDDLLAYLTRKNACDGCIRTARETWNNYKKDR